MNTGAIILFAAMALFFIVRMPISYSMLSACILYYIVEAPNALGNVFTVITGNTYAGFTMLAAPLFVFMANVMGEGEIGWLCVLAAFPFALGGFFQYNGMTLEQFILAFLRTELLYPGKLVFKSENLYAKTLEHSTIKEALKLD